MSRFSIHRAPVLAIPILLLAVACADHDATVEGAATQSEALDPAATPSASAPLRGHGGKRMGAKHKGGKHMKHGRHGSARLIHAALRHLDLSETQRATLTELKQSHKRPDEGANARGALQSLLAEGWKTGSVDQRAIDDALSGMQAQHSRRLAEQIRVTNQLHATLTAEQRQSLVTKLQQKHEKRGHKPHPDKMFAGKRKGHGMGMLRGIELTDDQRTQIEALMPARPARDASGFERGKQRRQALLEAFAKDSFDAANVMSATDKSSHLREFTQKQVEFVKQASKILSEEQRGELSRRLSDRTGRFDHQRKPHARPQGTTL